jgi:imidazolonepropionase-like amidohydrolase
MSRRGTIQFAAPPPSSTPLPGGARELHRSRQRNRLSRRRSASRRSASLPVVALAASLMVAAATGVQAQTPTGGVSGNQGTTNQGTTAFVGVTVIPMDSERTLPGQTVLVRDGIIQSVGPSESIRVPGDAVTIDGSGRYLLPGLAEMHAHVPPGEAPPRELVEETLFLYLAGGITTIRGMLGAPYQLTLREEIRRGEVLGPHFYVGAPSLNGNTAPTPADAERLVRAHAEAGYDLLKIHPGVPLDSWNRMVEVAREVGISFGGHVPADVGIYHAMETGMSTVDHLDGFLQVTRQDGVETDDLAELYRATDPTKLDELIRQISETGTWLVPTQYLWDNLNGIVDPDTMLALPEFRYISPEQREAYRNSAISRAENPAITQASTEAHRAMRHEFLSAAHRDGAPILMGTDSPQLFNVPGFALHRELPMMVAAGMTPFEVYLTGTRNVARYVEEDLGQRGNFGTVAPGYRADLLLLARNPLQSVEALRELEGVMVNGRWLPGQEIRERLAEIAAKYAAQDR